MRPAKMLASTVQFSTNNQPPPPAAPPDPNPPRGTRRCETRNGPGPKKHPPPPGAGTHSLRTQQRAYDPAPPHDPVPRTPEGAVLGADDEPATELVSVPPSSTTPDTPRRIGRPTVFVLTWPWTGTHTG